MPELALHEPHLTAPQETAPRRWSVEVPEPGVRLALSGRLDAGSLADVRSSLLAAVDGGQGDLVVSLAGAQVRDMSVLGVLLGAHRRALRLGRRLVLADVPPGVSRLLQVTRLHRVLFVES